MAAGVNKFRNGCDNQRYIDFNCFLLLVNFTDETWLINVFTHDITAVSEMCLGPPQSKHGLRVRSCNEQVHC